MRRFCILGWGKTGKHTAHYAREQNDEIVVWDDCSAKRQDAVNAGFNLWSDDWAWTGAIMVVSPGIDAHAMIDRARQEKIPVMSDIQLFFDCFPHVKAIGVTGSNGKTTTCALIEHGLLAHGVPCILAGNMGVPIFSTLVNGRPQSAIYVLELSSYQLELCSALPLTVAIVLNLVPHHLKRHGTVQNYGRIKQSILSHAHTRWIAPSWPIPQQDIVSVAEYSDEKWTQCQYASHCQPARGPVSTYMWTTAMLDGYRLPEVLKTEHNGENVAAALGALWSVGCMRKDVFMDFQGVEHRQEKVGYCNGILYCNDSKATNTHAAASALKACASNGPIFWIVGGVEQNDDLAVLDPWLDQVAWGFCMGSAKNRYAQWLASHHLPFSVCDSLEDAVDQAHAMAQKSQSKSCTVLLSPACASFDQFRDFEHRGEVFKSRVRQWIPVAPAGEVN